MQAPMGWLVLSDIHKHMKISLSRGTRNEFSGCMFLPSRPGLYTTFLKNCGRGESLETPTCPRTVVGVSKGMLAVKFHCPNRACFYVSRISWRS